MKQILYWCASHDLMSGVYVEDFTMANGTATPVSLLFKGQATAYSAPSFNDILHVQVDTVEVLAEYASDYYQGKPALTVNRLARDRFTSGALRLT
ncbi:beta-galactosidase trimerization domain-containing protein [Paenibacillus roseipurpureus]|uniref:Beta-galactosidase trimerization domain-containing protein n=1 Tax=Paenibacillus roseopurpureus TaxID=2918901 RepID=A0AA96RH25_9BACL|nr:beta-galactosidase trimerization domain-containing protein [Paenibacillus sp. MBLB1832]WNR42843.1 beta-galactosidase trimerization domain-containing protein [Paenibacillus sp. MBLB1832]